MKTEYRGILAVAISAAFFIAWFTFINPPKKNDLPPQAPAASASSPTGAAVPTEAPKEQGVRAATPVSQTMPMDPQSGIPIKTWTIKNGVIEAELTSDGGVPISWKIPEYRQGADPKSPPIDMAVGENGLMPPLSLSFLGSNFSFPERPRYELVAADDSHAVFRWRSSEAEVVKTIRFQRDSYLVDVAIDIKSMGSKVIEGRPMVSWSGVTLPPEKKGLLGFLKQPSPDNKVPVFFLDGKVKRETNAGKVLSKSEVPGEVLWAGLESRYFLGAIIPRVQGQGMAVEFGRAEISGAAPGTNGYWVGAAIPKLTTTAGETAKTLFSAYVGPKEINRLKEAGVKLEEAIDYGWFTIVAIPILYLLKFFYAIIHNYGIAIILLTVFVKLLLHPINVRSLKSMKAMQQLQPRLRDLQKKFQNDKQRLNQETMQLFRAHRVNPMGGCLPMLLQFPIYIALYKVLWNSIELYHAPFFWFYKDLSAPDPYLITPILLGIFMVAQQKLMPTTSADPAQQKMMMLMPIMFSVFMLFLPVGLVIYILINTATSVTQQSMYNKGIRMRDVLRGRWKPARA